MMRETKQTIITLIKDYPNPEIAAVHILELIKGIEAQIKEELLEEIDKLPMDECGIVIWKSQVKKVIGKVNDL